MDKQKISKILNEAVKIYFNTNSSAKECIELAKEIHSYDVGCKTS